MKMIGYCYQFSDNPMDLNALLEDDPYDAGLAGIDDKVELIPECRSAAELADALRSDGLDVSRYRNSANTCGWTVKTPDADALAESKRRHFKGKFDEFKRLAGGISIDGFIEYQNQDMLRMERCLGDGRHDHVALSGVTGTSWMHLDAFLRKLEPDRTYYLSDSCPRVT